MIKAVCNFPKIVYLIACDDEKVASALSRHTEGNSDGYDYLEKIVQCSFSIPNPSQQNLHGIFFKDLDEILEPVKHKELLFDETDWGNLFFDAIAPCLKTPRNVKVLINSMAAYYPPVKDEVNIVDFVGVQVLRVFYPQAYTIIQDKSNMLAGSTDDREDRKLQEAFYQELERQVPKNNIENFKKLMSRLFPRYAQLISNGMGYGSQWTNEWIKHRKVCSKEYFSLYFTLEIPESGISLPEMMAIISLADEPEAIKTKLRSFIEDDKKSHKKTYKSFLSELEYFTEDVFPKEKIKPFLQAMYDLSDDVAPDDHYREFMDIGIDMSMLRISYKLLKRFDSEEERFQILQSIFQNSTALSLIVREASLIHSKEEKGKENIVNTQQSNQLISIALERIRTWKNAGKLCSLNDFASVMCRWKEWSSESEVKEYASNLITSDKGLINFLTGLLSVTMSHSMGDSVTRKTYRVPRRYVQDFIHESQLATLVGRAKCLLDENDKVSGRQKIALTAFVDEMENPDKYRD
jgi:predicted KAP-like P-loop ATPase